MSVPYHTNLAERRQKTYINVERDASCFDLVCSHWCGMHHNDKEANKHNDKEANKHNDKEANKHNALAQAHTRPGLQNGAYACIGAA